MGRPLKIKQSTTTDIGFNAWNQLTNPVYPSTMSADQYVGVVGGANAQGGVSIATAAYPVVKARVFIAGAAAEDDGYIITQKGTTKYLVASISAVADEDMVVGRMYKILTVGTTNWSTCGAGQANPSAGDIFTATAVGVGTGTVQQVGICILANELDGALTEGNMNITMTADDSSIITISKLSNKWALDYSTPKVRYAVNFFADGATEIKSGTRGQPNTATQQDLVTLTAVEKYTS